MLPFPGHRRFVCAAIAVLAAGCQTYNPYAPYQGYPGYYMPPAGAVPAQGTTYGTPGMYQPTPANPQLGPTSAFPEAANDQWRQADGVGGSPSSTPNTFYEDIDSGSRVPENRTDERPTSPPSTSSTTGNRGGSPQGGLFEADPVPTGTTTRALEADSSADEFRRTRAPGNDRRTFESDDAPFDAGGADGSNAPAEELNPFGMNGQPQGPALAATTAGFQTSVEAAGQTVAQAGFARPQPVGTGPNPFAYDAAEYRWLRGVVVYDQEQRAWQLIYAASPDSDDNFGGTATLVGGDQRFNTLQANDVVLVEGRFDDSQRDPLGKPKYRVDHLARLVPNAN